MNPCPEHGMVGDAAPYSWCAAPAAPHPARALAHDIMNMIGVIRAHARLALCEAPESHVVAEHAEGIIEACGRAATMATKLWPSETGAENTQSLQNISPWRMAADVLRWLKPTLPKNIRVKICLDPLTPLVCADVAAMEQAFYNLMRNACQAMAAHGGVLHVSCSASEPPEPETPGLWCRITVQDTGPGLPASLLEHLGEPGLTTRSGHGGHGIGLATVMNTVNAHGGVMRVSSSACGAAFSLYLPSLGDAGHD
jgi:nitrogen-specific signal transduction histidine kinase